MIDCFISDNLQMEERLRDLNSLLLHIILDCSFSDI
jgi:hypothetical protein